MERRRAWLLVALVVAASAALRLAARRDDFWLDEVASYLIASDLRSAGDVFRLHFSANHHLISLWIYALGERAPALAYRLPSLLAGCASVALAAALAWRRDRIEACFAALALGGSFALIHFSSEARGYALAVGFALAALYAHERRLEGGSRLWTAALAISLILGFLSHPIFLSFWVGLAAGSGYALLRRSATLAEALARLAELHAPAGLAFALFLWADLRHLIVGSGDPTEAVQVVARTLGFGFGLPVLPGLALPSAAAIGGAIVWALFRMARAGDDRWLCHALGIAAPILLFVTLRPEVVAVRYFLVALCLALLLLAGLAAAGWRRGGWTRAGVAVATALFLIGNGVHCAAFLKLGRGGYRQALLFMASRTRGPEVVVGSDHDLRNRVVLRFHARALPADKRLDYLPRERWGPSGPDWLVGQRARRPERPRPLLRDAAGRRFRLAADFDHAAISGFWWGIYRNAGAEADRVGRIPRRP